jgi:hypothetical protein
MTKGTCSQRNNPSEEFQELTESKLIETMNNQKVPPHLFEPIATPIQIPSVGDTVSL